MRLVSTTTTETVSDFAVDFGSLEKGKTYFHPLASHRQSFALSIGEREYWGELVREREAGCFVVSVILYTRNARTGHGVLIRETAMAGLRTALAEAFRAHIHSDLYPTSTVAEDARLDVATPLCVRCNEFGAAQGSCELCGVPVAPVLVANTRRACYWRTYLGYVATGPNDAPPVGGCAHDRLASLLRIMGEDAATVERIANRVDPDPVELTLAEVARDTTWQGRPVRRDNTEYHAGRAAWGANATKDTCPYLAGGERAARWDLGWQEACDAAAPVSPVAPAVAAPVPAMVDYIDMTPTWSEILPAMLLIWSDGTDEARATIRPEFERMAALASSYVAARAALAR